MAIIPPNGFIGAGQQTQAVQFGLRQAMGTNRTMKRSGSSKRRKKKRAGVSSAPRKRRAKRGKARLVKGSAAAKAYMAKIRKKRKK